MMAGSPLSPPLITDARLSMRYLLFGFSPLWHLTQDFSSSGLMSFSNVRPFLSDAGGNLAASHSAFFLSFSAPISETAKRQNAAATRVQMVPPKHRGRRPDFMDRLFMADISTKDDSAVKKIHLNSADRWPARNTVHFLGPPALVDSSGRLLHFARLRVFAPSSVRSRAGVESG